MGTTLTGTTPQDTYDSLIKVTDNGPLSGTAKYLSDGLGNDSVLALSTSRVTIGGTNPYVGLLTIYGSASLSGGFGIRNSAGTAAGFLATYAAGSGGGSTDISIGSAGFLEINTAGAERMRITSTGNVGIGTSAPARLLTLKNNAGATNGISFQSLAATNEIAAIECNQTLDTIDFEMYSAFAGNGFRFLTGTTLVERARFTANGLTFNGDTAAANALDDYEEGTWTMGISFGGASVGVTYSSNTGTYTKIGRQVTVSGYLTLTSKGSSTGFVFITGLPFVAGGSESFYSTASMWVSNVSFANQHQSFVRVGETNVLMQEVTEAGVTSNMDDTNFANNSTLIISLTYFV